jgi:hypothetical protein
MYSAFNLESELFGTYPEVDEFTVFDPGRAGASQEAETRRFPARYRRASQRPRSYPGQNRYRARPPRRHIRRRPLGRPKPPPRPSWPSKHPRPPRRPRPTWMSTVVLPEPPPIQEGSEFVRWVQDTLNRVMNTQLPVDGIIGPETRDAIRDFQRRERLPVNGIAGPETKQALIEARRRRSSNSSEHEIFEDEQFLGSLVAPLSAITAAPPAILNALRLGHEALAIRLAILGGQRDLNKLTNMVFFARHPQRQGRKLVRGEPNFEQLAKEWLDIRNRLVKPALSQAPSTDRGPASLTATGPQGPFGTLTIVTPEQYRFACEFTPEDVEWLARFIVGEAGGKDNLDNRAIIWTMFNRYALFRHKQYHTFHQFIRAYSTTLQPSLNSWAVAARHMDKSSFVPTGGNYAPPHDNIPRGQLRQFLELQKRPWSKLQPEARSLAERAMKGQIPNPIGIASEFDNTRVYYHDQYKEYPKTYEQWRRFTEDFARRKYRGEWIGYVPGLHQMEENAFFTVKETKGLPPDTVRVVGPR